MPALANNSDTRTRAIFLLAARKPPHAVYANPFYEHAGFLNVFNVDEAGTLVENVQNTPLDETSAIHGMVFDPQEEYLYSADMWRDKIWCHRKVRWKRFLPSGNEPVALRVHSAKQTRH